ncbi:MAG: hypothetical protein M1536_08360 [Firmicutes bacterium]|nr:hypothetical protein [Bacillota bacterium]
MKINNQGSIIRTVEDWKNESTWPKKELPISDAAYEDKENPFLRQETKDLLKQGGKVEAGVRSAVKKRIYLTQLIASWKKKSGVLNLIGGSGFTLTSAYLITAFALPAPLLAIPALSGLYTLYNSVDGYLASKKLEHEGQTLEKTYDIKHKNYDLSKPIHMEDIQ